jgi:hypothetical protein
MVQSYRKNRRTHYRPDIAWKRHDDGGRPASDPEQLG